MDSLFNSSFKKHLEDELTGNILPFWMNYPVDKVNGGFYGALSNDLQIHNEIPRSAILCARILWTISTAYQKYRTKSYMSTAEYAYEYLSKVFWDQEYGGLYWSVDSKCRPVHNRKHHYAQAFGIYGFTAYYQATGETCSLELAQIIFQLLEQHAYDPVYGGYIEGSSRNWDTLRDMRLSKKEINCSKSMNTMLHILEAYTALLQVWKDAQLKAQHKALIEIFLSKIIDAYKSWWLQAEVMVGFYNAFQHCKHTYFAEAVQQCWSYIQTNLVDREHGDWYKQRDPDGHVNDSVYKVGSWECPYLHSRACLELLKRLH